MTIVSETYGWLSASPAKLANALDPPSSFQYADLAAGGTRSARQTLVRGERSMPSRSMPSRAGGSGVEMRSQQA